MEILTVGDFAIRYKRLGGNRLPLERIEAVEGDSFIVINRFRANSSVSKKALMKLEPQYERVVWDELVQIEQRLRFLMQCQRLPDTFGYLQGVGLVKLSGERKVTSEIEPWEEIECNPNLIERISDARVSQIEAKLTSLEEEHEFLSQAIEFLC